MSQGSEFALPDVGSLRRGRFAYLPVAPGRMEFAIEVRRRILAEKPQVVVVELPGWLERHYFRAVKRLPQITVLVYPDEKDDDRGIYIPVEPADPFTEAVRTAGEIGARIVFAEPDAGERPHLPDVYPDPFSLRAIGIEQYIERYRLFPMPRTGEVADHAAGIAWKLQGADPEADVLVVLSLNLLDPVLDAMEEPQEPPARRRIQPHVDLLNPHPDCLAEILVEYPFLQERYERFRPEMADVALIDRLRSQLALFREAEALYEKNTGDRISHWQRRMIARYARNLATINSDLAAALFDLTVAARSVVDDNYAWEVWETANRYAPQQAKSDIQTANVAGEEVWLDTRRLRLRRRLPRPKRRLRPASLRPRKKEKTPGEWARQLDGNSICSYPPEDITIEDYGRFLKQKAKSMLSEERMRVEPFTTSILDGIDLRETVRNWHEGKIYVRECQKVAGEVGAVVVIFDEDRDDRYPYLTTWLGEHQNESDMAFFSTQPFDHMVGPGIGRAEYGGFLMTLPARRMFDVWGDPDYNFAETKPERLLLAALDYSIHRFVVYVAARPPRSVFRSISAGMGRSILYIPIGQLSPSKLKKIRVVHVLDSHARRAEAAQYIW
ncbi:MAG: hypothetical protein KIT09_30260 [Bryobacteraceae bacterium]|nr:hypothetical protein [Bryobacteraceae bacterium]